MTQEELVQQQIANLQAQRLQVNEEIASLTIRRVAIDAAIAHLARIKHDPQRVRPLSPDA